MERILVPLDGSPRAEQILVQVARLLRREEAELMLLSVAEPGGLDAAARYLDATAGMLAKQGVRARTFAREGPVAESILKAAADENAGLIALSTHGRSGVARWLLGSVCEKILRAADAPVLLTRAFPKGPQGLPLPAGPGELPFRRLLVPVDGSDGSLHVVPAAAAFARLFGAEVDVLSVEDLPRPPLGVDLPRPTRIPAPQPGPETVAAAEKAAKRFEAYGVAARALPAVGEPAALILETADALRSDLIAMATHGRSGVTRWALGSVTERIVRHATLPMLVVRARS